jgi:hypothetical protein
MASHHRSQACRQGEGDQKVGNRQQQPLLFGQPFLASLVLTFRTMAVATRTIDIAVLLTTVAVVDLAA